MIILCRQRWRCLASRWCSVSTANWQLSVSQIGDLVCDSVLIFELSRSGVKKLICVWFL